MIIVATYHSLPTPNPILRELTSAGVAPDDVRVVERVDPVVANAPASIEKEGGFFQWLTGIEDLDVDAYRRAVERGRTVVSVRAVQAQADKIESILERFGPIDVTEEDTTAGPAGNAASAIAERPRVRRYITPADKPG